MKLIDARRMIVSLVDLPGFIEQESGVSVVTNGDDKAKCLCPLHNDTDASFSMTRYDDGWGFHCFGCQSSGTVVEFYKEYYGIDSSRVAMEMICDELGIDEEEILNSFINNVAENDSNRSKDILAMHMQASFNCQSLLRFGHDRKSVVKWVNTAYREMNAAIESVDYISIEMIADLANEKIERILM
jgi:DNA primase